MRTESIELAREGFHPDNDGYLIGYLERRWYGSAARVIECAADVYERLKAEVAKVWDIGSPNAIGACLAQQVDFVENKTLRAGWVIIRSQSRDIIRTFEVPGFFRDPATLD